MRQPSGGEQGRPFQFHAMAIKTGQECGEVLGQKTMHLADYVNKIEAIRALLDSALILSLK